MTRRFGVVKSDEVSNWRVDVAPATLRVVSTTGGGGAGVGASPWNGTINGAPNDNGDGTWDVTYTNVGGNEDSMDWVSGETNIVLHNTTRGEKARINNINLATNVMELEDNAPDDLSAWANTDAITTSSQTNTGRGGGYMDVDVTDFMQDTDASVVILLMQTKATNGVAGGQWVILHPYETFAASKDIALETPAAFQVYIMAIMKVVWENSRAYITLNTLASGASNTLQVSIRYEGEFV